ncbi:unnamed protein product, partial [Symbiodinium pilosum]
AYAPLVEGICLGIRDQAAAARAAETLCLILERLRELSLPATSGFGSLGRHPHNLSEDTPALWHLSAHLIATGLECPFARCAVSSVLNLLDLGGDVPKDGKPDELLTSTLRVALSTRSFAEKDVFDLLSDCGIADRYPKVGLALEVIEDAPRSYERHRQTQSAVFTRVARDFAAAQGPSALRCAVAPLMAPLPSDSKGPLDLPGYVPQLLGALAPAIWMPKEGPGEATRGPVVRFPDKEQLQLLEHVHDLLRLLPTAASSHPCLRDLAELFGR